MTLDELLDRAGAVDAPAPDAVNRLADTIASAARADLTRRAVLVRRRRIARIGSAAVALTAAAAIGGFVALQPSAHAPSAQTKPLMQVTPQFRTVAQVINAAAAATPNVNPAASPYWKVVTRDHSEGCTVGPGGPQSCAFTTNIHTMWMGNGRPGVLQIRGDMDVTESIPAEAIRIGGTFMSWQDVNARQWTVDQLAALVGDDVPPGKPGRAPAEWYIFKNTGDLLMNSPASADIRKQLWRHLATVSGVHLDGRATDSQGRQGWKLSISMPAYGTQAYVVDPDTGAILESIVQFPQDTSPSSIITLISAGPASTVPTFTPADGPHAGPAWRAWVKAHPSATVTPAP